MERGAAHGAGELVGGVPVPRYGFPSLQNTRRNQNGKGTKLKDNVNATPCCGVA